MPNWVRPLPTVLGVRLADPRWPPKFIDKKRFEAGTLIMNIRAIVEAAYAAPAHLYSNADRDVLVLFAALLSLEGHYIRAQ